MKRLLLIYVVDVLALFAAFRVGADAYGLLGGLLSCVAVAAYGCACYWDGITR
jgi:hypothetical protein